MIEIPTAVMYSLKLAFSQYSAMKACCISFAWGYVAHVVLMWAVARFGIYPLA